jgi:hypothetical protein
MLADIGKYLWELGDHWAAFMTGGPVVAVLIFWERWRNRNIPFRFYAAVFLVVGLAAASFQTWQQERTARMLAEQSIRHSRDVATARQLQKFYAEASQFQREAAAAANGSDEEFNSLQNTIDAWSKETGPWILQNMGEAAYHRVIQSEGLPNMNAVGSERARLMLMMGAIRDNLSKLLENPAWDKP